jgi:NTP pyrophosphatase (non-canonical NTP hydrolase)
MNLNAYQREASGTAIYPGRMSPHGMMYCALKMNGEAGELADHVHTAFMTENYEPRHFGLRPGRVELIVKEIGDVMWYLAAMADELETDLYSIFGREPVIVVKGTGNIDREALKLNAIVGQIAEQLGKAMRDDGYGMPLDFVPGQLRVGDAGNGSVSSLTLTADRRGKIIRHMHEAIESLMFISNDLSFSLQMAMEINIKKLAARKAKGTLSGSGDNR